VHDDGVVRRPVLRVTAAGRERIEDALAVERALEIRIDGRALAVTLRTPGHDDELVTGFLASEGLVRSADELAGVALRPAACTDEPDVADVALAGGVALDWTRLERHFAATSACGLCGRAHLESLRAGLEPCAPGAPIALAGLLALSARLRPLQGAFLVTGGLHAAAWCDDALAPQVLREDVGRHNAVDKVVGWRLRARSAPGGVLWVSGRAGAELVLKAARARVPVLVAVGAPSSLAVELAEVARVTLVGFLGAERLNVYAGAERIAP
jgi:FdhD protein